MKFENKKFYLGIFIVLIIILGVYVNKVRSKNDTSYYLIEKRDIDLIVQSDGYVESNSEAQLYPEIAEIVTMVFVEEGDEVKKGDVLATLSTDSLAQSLKYARDTRDIALLERNLFIENYETNMDAVGGEDEYKIKLNILNEQISKAEAQYNSAQVNKSKTSIAAPFDGTVSKVHINTGELSSVNRTAFELKDVQQPKIYSNVSEVEIRHIDKGDKVEIIFDAFPEKIYSGEISSINTTEDVIQGVSYYKVSINPESFPEDLRLGMNAEVKISAETRKNVVAVPLYLIEDVSKSSGTVQLLTEKGIEDKELELGLNNYTYVEVLSGLEEGDRIVEIKE